MRQVSICKAALVSHAGSQLWVDGMMERGEIGRNSVVMSSGCGMAVGSFRIKYSAYGCPSITCRMHTHNLVRLPGAAAAQRPGTPLLPRPNGREQHGELRPNGRAHPQACPRPSGRACFGLRFTCGVASQRTGSPTSILRPNGRVCFIPCHSVFVSTYT